MALGIRGFNRKKGGEGGFVPFEQTFSYTGAVQTLQIPTTGLYQLEVWGASGGGGTSGGQGGYSKGYKFFKKKTTLYIAVGGQGTIGWVFEKRYWPGGFNGGGSGSNAQDGWTGGGGGSGGGATHIALVDGTISAIGKTDFVDNGKGLIIAGGGGSYAVGINSGEWVYASNGGSGGGTNGGNGATGYYVSAGGGGTQSAGGSAGSGDSYVQAGSFGQGGGMSNYGAGGGGGLYGGGASKAYAFMVSAAGGGSGYIGGVPAITYKGTTYSPSTQNGGRSNAHGQAKITRIA